MTKKLKLASLKTDLRKEDEGDWVDSITFEGVRYLMRSLNSTDYRLSYAVAMKNLSNEYGRKPIPPDEVTTTVGGLMAKYLLRGWEGLDPEFSPEVAADTLSNAEFREVIADIEASASQVARGKREYTEEQAGNSGAPSGTN